MSIPLLADGFEKAFVGMAVYEGQEVAVYDIAKCTNVLMKRDKMTLEEAQEYLEFNVTTAWVGKGTPIFISVMSIKEFNRLGSFYC